MGKIKIIDKEIIKCKELKIKLKIEKIKTHQTMPKIAIGYSIIPRSFGLKL